MSPSIMRKPLAADISRAPYRCVVIGLGNPLLCDDGAGLRIAALARRELAEFSGWVDFKENFSGGFDLLYDLTGYNAALLVDSVQTGAAPPGTVLEFRLGDLAGLKQSRIVDSHGLNVPTVMALGRACGYSMPREVVILGIEVTDVTNFSTMPTAPVCGGMRAAVERVRRQLLAWDRTKMTRPAQIIPETILFHGEPA
ncbi:MAG: hydrogenase maturation protease [Chitinivibrionales bacterium]|nr:hydrogenase maturation protease [Chitinivibrionales bacterium]